MLCAQFRRQEWTISTPKADSRRVTFSPRKRSLVRKSSETVEFFLNPQFLRFDGVLHSQRRDRNGGTCEPRRMCADIVLFVRAFVGMIGQG